MPPLRRNSRILDLIYDEDPDERQTPAARILEQFKKDLTAIEDAIGDAVHLRRMRSFTIADPDGTEHLSDELVNYLNFCLGGEAVALKIPPLGAYLDTLIGLEELWNSDTPRFGDRFVACVAIQGLGLTRFGGHPEAFARGAADAKNTPTVFAGISPPDGRPRPCWA